MAQEYPILPNSIIELQVLGTIHGQRTRNIFHYFPVSATGMDNGRDEISALITSFQGSVLPKLLECATAEWKCDMVTGQHVLERRYRKIERTVGIEGMIAGNALPSYCAAVVSRIGQESGKKQQGRIYVAGVPAQQETNSRLLPAYVTLLEALGLTLTRRQDATVGPNLFAPTLKGPSSGAGAADSQEVVDYQARDILRVQRRREVGVGE